MRAQRGACGGSALQLRLTLALLPRTLQHNGGSARYRKQTAAYRAAATGGEKIAGARRRWRCVLLKCCRALSAGIW